MESGFFFEMMPSHTRSVLSYGTVIDMPGLWCLHEISIDTSVIGSICEVKLNGVKLPLVYEHQINQTKKGLILTINGFHTESKIGTKPTFTYVDHESTHYSLVFSIIRSRSIESDCLHALLIDSTIMPSNEIVHQALSAGGE